MCRWELVLCLCSWPPHMLLQVCMCMSVSVLLWGAHRVCPTSNICFLPQKQPVLDFIHLHQLNCKRFLWLVPRFFPNTDDDFAGWLCALENPLSCGIRVKLLVRTVLFLAKYLLRMRVSLKMPPKFTEQPRRTWFSAVSVLSGVGRC